MTDNPSGKGQLIVLSGPSGVGKTSIVQRMLAECCQPLILSVSATTRAPRPGEIDGVDYHFLSDEEFQRRRKAGAFLECCELYGGGHWYGTLRESVETSLNDGKWVILEIDVAGAMKVIDGSFPDAITVFVRPRSLAELEQRLRERGTETERAIEQRLDRARHELSYADRYRNCLVNDTLEQTVHDICQLLNQHA